MHSLLCFAAFTFMHKNSQSSRARTLVLIGDVRSRILPTRHQGKSAKLSVGSEHQDLQSSIFRQHAVQHAAQRIVLSDRFQYLSAPMSSVPIVLTAFTITIFHQST
ncbi:uncharacterized protein PHALS_15161 [Plasmopara halstedii]|uniref:Uncharacterized protein n=1 Tax=Plasmopara halstedii TaxID=4781 RepID=A0A0P1B2F1_PLAHL|nr:uncharacterized protein PHALS_15161 [Plasmopara halstedii]CEG48620.1 hypothetical protein PHALS_15161 [Plasmopara halstedii]|eukprot:XP_024584989.1 hypothetical protein PHALS_15161 [Plasmopara halstedii]